MVTPPRTLDVRVSLLIFCITSVSSSHRFFLLSTAVVVDCSRIVCNLESCSLAASRSSLLSFYPAIPFVQVRFYMLGYVLTRAYAYAYAPLRAVAPPLP